MKPRHTRGSGKAAIVAGLTVLASSLLTGCHSHFVQVTVENATGGKVQIVEVDYPSASFGIEELASGATYHYRFKVLGSGPSKVSWTDAKQAEHTVKGPELHEGEEGTLVITLGPGDAVWKPVLTGQ